MGIQFNEQLKTGIFTIDVQHKELFMKVDELYKACLEGKGKEEITNIMKYLGKYVTTHFKTEEEYMAKYLYRGLDRHKAAHFGFVANYKNLLEKFEEEGPSSRFIVSVNKTLINWLLEHLGGEDKLMAEFLRDKIKD